MASRRFIQLGSLTSVMSGVLWMIGLPALARIFPGVTHNNGHLLLGLASLCSLVGLIGLAALEGGRTAVHRRAGLFLAGVGAALGALDNTGEGVFGTDIGSRGFLFGILLLLVGLALYGKVPTGIGQQWHSLPLAIGVLGALAVPCVFTWATWPWIPSTPARLIGYLGLILGIALGAGWIMLGRALWLFLLASGTI
jgi:hypothetical protein